jgi:peptidoglycan-N-acetylglucosamine deacetylase
MRRIRIPVCVLARAVMARAVLARAVLAPAVLAPAVLAPAVLACAVLACLAIAGAARAAECPGHPDAIGTSRTIYVDPTEHPRVGTMQYQETLPLNDHEVVLTFDDGPLPPKTTRVLDILASECVKATFFAVGSMAQEFPAVLRRERAEGHSIGTHSQNHPLNFEHAPLEKVAQEVDEGIASVTAALGDANDVAPFFRIPGLERAESVENLINSRSLMIWSADFPADDWKHIRPSEVYRRALMRIEAHHKGVLLLHDIQPATVAALPVLLRELKRRGYHIVHVEPASAEQPKTPADPSQWLMSRKKTPESSPEIVGVDTFNGEASAHDAAPQQTQAPVALTPPSPAPSVGANEKEARGKNLAMRIPLPPRRPRAAEERSEITVPLPAPMAIGRTGVPQPIGTGTQGDLTTGSIGSASEPSKPENRSDRDEPVLRPSADIPAPKLRGTP